MRNRDYLEIEELLVQLGRDIKSSKFLLNEILKNYVFEHKGEKEIEKWLFNKKSVQGLINIVNEYVDKAETTQAKLENKIMRIEKNAIEDF